MRLVSVCSTAILLCSIRDTSSQDFNINGDIIKPCIYSRVFFTNETEAFFSTTASTNTTELHVDLVDGHQTTWSEEYVSCRVQRYINNHLTDGMKAVLRYLPLSTQKFVLACCNVTVSYLRLLSTGGEHVDSLVSSVYLGQYSVLLTFLDVIVAAKLAPTVRGGYVPATSISVLLPHITLKLTWTTEYKRDGLKLFKNVKNVATRVTIVDKPEIQPIIDPKHQYDIETIDKYMESHVNQIFGSLNLKFYATTGRDVYNNFMGIVDVRFLNPAPFLPMLQILDYEANELKERKRRLSERPVASTGSIRRNIAASASTSNDKRIKKYISKKRAKKYMTNTSNGKHTKKYMIYTSKDKLSEKYMINTRVMFPD